MENHQNAIQEEDDSKIFPQKLMDILSDPDVLVQESICWLPHGRAFKIRNRGQFEKHVMPKFFHRKAKYSSFTRKLNRWNFVRVSSGPEHGAYYHEFFRRDRPQLAAQMFCKNPRTMLAMASEKNKRAEEESTSPKLSAQHSSSTTNGLPEVLGMGATRAAIGGIHGFPSSEMDKLNDLQQRSLGGVFHPNSLLSASALAGNPNNARFLEHQILLLQQQEETNRILLQRALLLQQQRRQLNIPSNTNPYNLLAEEQKLQDDQSLRLRQLLRMSPNRRSNKGRSNKPSNNRASAANTIWLFGRNKKRIFGSIFQGAWQVNRGRYVCKTINSLTPIPCTN